MDTEIFTLMAFCLFLFIITLSAYRIVENHIEIKKLTDIENGTIWDKKVHIKTIKKYFYFNKKQKTLSFFHYEHIEYFYLRTINLPNELKNDYMVCEDKVREYMDTTDPIPPIIIDTLDNVLDGAHRLVAAFRSGKRQINALVPKSNLRRRIIL